MIDLPYATLDPLGYVHPVAIESPDDLLAWGHALVATQRVAFDQVGALEVSTVFLGLRDWPFETMLFKPDRPRPERWQYRTRQDALANHGTLVMQLRAALEEDRR
jgi:hypothetical protein